MKFFKKLLPMIFTLAFITVMLVITSTTVSAETYSGECGDDLTWSLDTSTGVLAINGTGDMYDYEYEYGYEYETVPPWRSYQSHIKSVVVSDGVTRVGNYSFYMCESLTDISLHNSVISIGDYAFGGCDSLTNAVIPDSVEKMGDHVFSYSSSLECISVDDGNNFYSSIDGVLYNKDITVLIQYPVGNLRTAFVIPDTVTSIGKDSFAFSDFLTSVTIPDSVTSIGEDAFIGCNSIESVYITDIALWCSIDFYNEDANPAAWVDLYLNGELITDLVIPDTVTSIGNYAFYSLSLTSVTIPDSVTSVGVQAFFSYSSVSSVYITDLASWCSIDFCDYGSNPLRWADLYLNGELVTELVIPDTVESIGNHSFEACDSITSVIIPNSVTSIGESAFYYCDSLTSVTIGNSVTSIGDSAFYECNRLTGVIIPDSVISIGTNAFYNCGSLKSVSIGNSVESIGNSAFYDCSIKSVTIPDSVKSIGDDAFFFCQSLKTIIIGSSVENIGKSAFAGCGALIEIIVDSRNGFYESVDGILYNESLSTLIQYPIGVSNKAFVVPSSVVSIENQAFYSCDFLTSVILPNSVTSIGDWSFGYCTSLTSIIIPGSVTKISDNLFSGCSSLVSVDMPNSVTSIGKGAFALCTSLTNVIIPDSVTSIGDEAFHSCTSLTSMTVPGSVTKIPVGLFDSCSALVSVDIQSPVTSIGNYAFSYCTSLTSITISDSVTSIGKYVFQYCESLEYIVIPCSVIDISVNVFFQVPNVVIGCYEDSRAYYYAKREGLNFKLLTCDHKYVDYISNDDATCITDGTKTAKCDNGCGTTNTIADIGSATGHMWNKWYTLTKPTYENIGIEERACSVCGITENREIPIIEEFDNPFTDIKASHWFYSSVEFVVKKGYMKGMSDTTFSPNSNITREQFVLILANIAGVDTNAYKNTASGFDDVKTGQWYSGAVTWAVNEGYVSGMSETKFGRGQSINRAALARMLYNYAGANGIDTTGRADLSAFGDAAEFEKSGNAWMVEPIQWAVDAGIISGMNVNGKLSVNPKGTATRAQAAVMLMKFDELMK